MEFTINYRNVLESMAIVPFIYGCLWLMANYFKLGVAVPLPSLPVLIAIIVACGVLGALLEPTYNIICNIIRDLPSILNLNQKNSKQDVRIRGQTYQGLSEDRSDIDC